MTDQFGSRTKMCGLDSGSNGAKVARWQEVSIGRTSCGMRHNPFPVKKDREHGRWRPGCLRIVPRMPLGVSVRTARDFTVRAWVSLFWGAP